MWKKHGIEPYICNGSKEIEFENDYFLLYHLGENAEGDVLFVFETCNINKYLNIVTNIRENDIAYFHSKGWFAGVCVYKDDKFIYQDHTLEYYFEDELRPIQDESTILLMKNDPPFYYRSNYDLKEDSKLFIKHYCK